MKKKIVIISIISVLIVVIGVTSFCVSRNKISNIKVSEDSILANDLASVEIDNDEENTENLIVEEEQSIDESDKELEEQIVETETSIQPQTTQQVKSSSKTTDNAGTQFGVLLRNMTNVDIGEKKTVFCSQHGVDINTGVRVTGNYYTPTSPEMKKACKIAYFGWYSKYGDYVLDGGISADRKLQYVLVQQFIWETLGQSNATFVDSSIQSQYEALKNTINSQINSTSARPSFDATTIELDAGDSYTATDSNGILASYNKHRPNNKRN